jgi:hypothetical protein
MATLNIKGFPDELYSILGALAKEDQRSISAEAIYLIKWAIAELPKNKRSIMELKGLGKKKWKGIDALQHVKKERQAWDS